ncbi:MAG: EAL domain-containing protein [Gammaproteobacteria bacterium]|nr:EAL domain-containing protein [Gammaproteobacteria bacterium]
MRLQSKFILISALIFLLHFIVNTYIGQYQIKSAVVSNIKENARTIRGLLMSYRGVNQKIFLEHNIPINDTTIKFLPAHTISRISKDFNRWVGSGLTFNNVSDRPRNPDNQADATELEAMMFFRQNPEEKERFVPYQEVSGENYYHYSQPILVQPHCMKCHGIKENAPESIQKLYDTAYDYNIGDLRGIMSIKLPTKIIEQRTSELIKRNIIFHLLGMFVSFILIYILMNRSILSRIKLLQYGSEKLASGQYDTQIKLSGNDELTDMEKTFNTMSQTIARREQSLIKLQSLYYALSQTNKSILKLDSDDFLFKQICEITINQPNIILAWVATLNEEKNELITVASSGESKGCLSNISFKLEHESNQFSGPVITAFYQNKVTIINDYQNDLSTYDSHDYVKQANIKSVISLPICKNQKVIGVFSVYSDQVDYFINDIVNLLQEMTSDIEYALAYYDLQQKNKETQQKLHDSSRKLTEVNELMSMLLESTGEGIFGVDMNGCCTFVNHAAQEMFGYSLKELKSQSMHQLTLHHYKDGSEFPSEDSPIYNAYRTGKAFRINNQVFWRKNGNSFPVQYSAYPIHDGQKNITGSVTVFRDTTETEAMTQKMNFLASHDSLTSLFNRYSFEQHLTGALGGVQSEDTQHVVCYLDLDQFKVVNDTCGHLAGDELLKMIAHLLSDNVRKNDTLARLGGDEFGLLLKDCSIEQATALAEKICKAVKDFRFIWEDKVFSIGVSIGITAITQDSKSVQSILSEIDSACYIAKENGRNRVHINRANDIETARHHGEMNWVSEIRQALEDDRFILYQQTIMPSRQDSQMKRHFEILLRMKNIKGEIIPPGAFLPAAERYDLMEDLDKWVISSTFRWLASRNQMDDNIDFCSINLSGQSIGEKKLCHFIMMQQKKFKIKPEMICFEITESAAITHLQRAMEFIHLLREQGFLFALDDFGTGMSSFAYLKNLPVDFLKIDGSFVKDIVDDPIDRAMVKSINDIGHIMGLKTIAEYVENEAIRDELTKMGVDYLQGYGIKKPRSLSDK